MPKATYLAPAKINLFLHITSKRTDGYHNLQTIFQLLDYGDEITFSLRNDGQIKRIYGNETIPPEKDLILRSANNLKKYSSGHVYFVLKDKMSQISCVMFSSYYTQLNVDLNDGEKVVLS